MARIVVTSGPERGREFELSSDQSIGRLSSNEIPFDDSRMSRKNTRIYFMAQAWWLEDLDSKNGSYLNEKKITKVRLNNDDEIRVGETHFSFLAEGDDPANTSEPELIEIGKTSQVSSPTASDRVLTFSKNASATNTSMMWMRQDLGQRGTGFRLLMGLGFVLVLVAMVWLIQEMIGGS